MVKILAISDQRLPEMENLQYLRTNYHDVDFIISCGDMEPSYLEFVASALNRPLFYVRGNHDTNYQPNSPGGQNLDRRYQVYKRVRMIGLEGSMYYNGKNVQYTQFAMHLRALSILPRLLFNRLIYGYGVDYLVTHSPPKGIHDRSDLPHHGFSAFLWLMRWAKPRYLIHGHIDVWDRREKTETQFYDTKIINIDPKRLLTPDE